jgi:XTP/dITP diphosphohydrolase
VEPETALQETNAKFLDRFRFMEAAAKSEGQSLDGMTLGELDALWQRAKAAESEASTGG